MQILDEFKISLWLQNKTGLDGHIRRDFDWFIGIAQDGTENYLKVQNGRYRDKPSTGLSDKTEGNLRAAQEAMAAILELRALEGEVDGNEGSGDIYDGVVEAGRGERGDPL